MSEVDIRLRTQPRPRPTDTAILLAALPGRYDDRDGWVVADTVRARLEALGFTVHAQQVAAWLGRLGREDLAPVERRQKGHFRDLEYRVTRHGITQIANQLPSVRAETPWIPVMRAR